MCSKPLEYLDSGQDSKSPRAALHILVSIATGPFSCSERTIAFSPATYTANARMIDDIATNTTGPSPLEIGMYAEKSMRLGLCSFACSWIVGWFDGITMESDLMGTFFLIDSQNFGVHTNGSA